MNEKKILIERLNFAGLTDANPAGCGCIEVMDENKMFSFLNARGKEITPKRYKSIRYFSDGLAPVWDREGWGYINPQGEMVLPHRWYRAAPFCEGSALVEGDDGRMIINKQGEVLLREQEGWRLMSSFHDGLALVGVNKRAGIFGRKKARHFPPSCMITGDFYWHGCNQFGFVDMQGRMAIKPTLDGAKNFSEGLAAVCRYDKNGEEKWGYMDANGRMAIPFEWDMAENFHDGCAIVLDDGVLLDMIDRSGKAAIPKRFSGLSNFSGGLATFGMVCTENGVQTMKHGFINRSGEIVVPARWDECLPVDFGGLRAVKSNGTWKLIALDGEIVSDGWDELKLSEDGVGLGRGGDWWIIRAANKIETPCIAGAGEEQENEG